MPEIFRAYDPEPRLGADYRSVRDFLIRLGDINYPFGRWDWMITHGYLDASGLSRIGLWEADGQIVALATYDCQLGKAFLLMENAYRHLAGELIDYAHSALAKEGKCMILIPDGEGQLQDAAARRGFVATQDNDRDAVYPIDDVNRIAYPLPAGFRITSMKETYDLFKYRQVLWKGFNHERDGEGPLVFREADRAEAEREMNRPNVNLDLKIAVVAPNGDFVSYCGMWQDDRSDTALVEPVATDPAYRRMGLGRAAVLEGIRRCGLLGAKRAFVGSSQQFYYDIGFRPYRTSTFWVKRVGA